MLKVINRVMGYKTETKEEELERTLSYYIREMSAKEERIRNQKKKYESIIEELNKKYETLENKYKSLKKRKA